MRESHPAPTAVFSGFDPFGPHLANPSREAAQGAAAAWPGPAEARVLPVTWAGCVAAVDAIAALRPQVVVHFGLAADRHHVCVETVARNGAGAVLDNAGHAGASTLQPGAPETRETRAGLPARLALDAAAWCPVALRVSRDAGQYICNATYFAALGHPGLADATVLFVHIPAIGEAHARAVGAAIARALAPLA